MKRNKIYRLINTVKKAKAPANSEKGAALVVSLLILLFLMGFAAFSISRVTTETVITGNDSAESRAYAAATGGLELATQEINSELSKIISPPPINTISNAAATGVAAGSGTFDNNYNFTTAVSPYGNSCQSLALPSGPHAGLNALRNSYRLDVTAQDSSTEAEVQLMRTFYTDRIPLFQFGQFANYDLDMNFGPLYYQGGRVHTNQNMFLQAGSNSTPPPSATPDPDTRYSGIYFSDMVTVAGEIVNTHVRTGAPVPTPRQNKVFIKDDSGANVVLNTGNASTICGSGVSTSEDIFASSPHIQVSCKRRDGWGTDQAQFDGNLETSAPTLNMPLFELGDQSIEIIRRGKNNGDKANISGTVSNVTDATQDSSTLSNERFANKSGIRISLADSKQRLPGCAEKTGDCGVNLTGDLTGDIDVATGKPVSSSVGYIPEQMNDGYQATTLNGTRFNLPSYIPSTENEGLWIKVESVGIASDGSISTSDITQDFLSLGVTERAPDDFQIDGYNTLSGVDRPDNRSIIKLQRFAIPGVKIVERADRPSLITYYDASSRSPSYNYVQRHKNVTSNPYNGGDPSTGRNSSSSLDGKKEDKWESPNSKSSSVEEDNWHLKWAQIGGSSTAPKNMTIVPFPINLFDTRESIAIFYQKNASDERVGRSNAFRQNIRNNYNTRRALHSSGVMSLVDIDVGNLNRFFDGAFDGQFPNSLMSGDIPSDRGWVLYVSDRRGDINFDGQYDPYSSSAESPPLPEPGDSANLRLGSIKRSRAAVSDHNYYRRGVRLINAAELPGNYNSATSLCTASPTTDTKGFTVASENIIYVQGNYNVTSITHSTTTEPTSSSEYAPQDTVNHIPAAIVADDIAILSTAWEDSRSFHFPYNLNGRPAANTEARFAMISGFVRRRILENWQSGSSPIRYAYSGSSVWIFNSEHGQPSEYPSRANRVIYEPPQYRDWTFEESFSTMTRLPPGTPYAFLVGLTGFQRVNE